MIDFDPTSPTAEADAYQSGLLLSKPPEDFDTPFPDGSGQTLRSLHQTRYDAWYDHQQARNLPIFPTEAAKAARAQTDAYQKTYTTGLDKLNESLTPEQVAMLDTVAEGTDDPEEAKARAINANWLKAIAGRDIDPAALDDVARAYAAQLGRESDEPLTHKELFGLIQQRFTEDSTAEQSFRNGVQSWMERSIGNAQDGISREDKAAILDAVPERLRDTYHRKLNESARETMRMGRRVEKMANEITANIEAMRQSDDPQRQILGDIDRMVSELPDDPAERAMLLAMVNKRLQSLPELDRGTFFRMGQAATAGVNQAGLKYNFATQSQVRALGIRAGGFSDENREMILRRNELLDAIAGKALDFKKASDGFIARSFIAAAPSAWMLPAAFSGVGMAAIAQSMAGDNIARSVAEGATDNAATTGIGTAAGAAQGLVEIGMNRLGGKILMGKLPTFHKILNKTGVSNPLGRAALGATAGAAGITVGEYTEEVAQGVIGEAFNALAKDLSGLQDTDIDWGTYLKGWATVSTPEARETLQAISAFAMVGGGAAGFHHFRNGRAMQRNAAFMAAEGFTKQEAAAVLHAESQEAASAAFKAGLEAADKRAAENPDLANNRQKLRAAYLENLKAANEAYKAAGMPVIEAETNEFTEETTYNFRDPKTGTVTPYETEEDAFAAWMDWRDGQVAEDVEKTAAAAEDEALDTLTGEGSLTEDTNTEIIDQDRTPAIELAEAEKTKKKSEEDARNAKNAKARREAEERYENAKGAIAAIKARLEIFALDHGINFADPDAMGRMMGSLRIRAKNFANYLNGELVGYTVQLFNGRDIQDVYEDFAEVALKKSIDEGFANPAALVSDIRQLEKAMGIQLMAEGYSYSSENAMPLIEAFSRLSRAYLMGNVRSGLLPETVKTHLEMQAALSAAVIDLKNNASQGFQLPLDIQTAGQLRDAIAAGEVTPRLERLLKDSLGLDEKARNERLEKKYQEQMAAEAMDGFPVLLEEAKGRLPHPQTLRENNHPLYGEVKRLWDALTKPTRRRNKQGRTVDRTNEANAFFLPVGEMQDLDDVRESLNARGFEFDSITDMIDALDLSLSYGKTIYGTASTGAESYALGRATVTPTAETRTFEGEGVTVIGPASFAISAHHGTPHTFKPETLYRLPDGSEQWFVDEEESAPEGSTIIKRAPKGRFRADKVGTGEGAQAYGWGVAYVAEAEGVAKEYQKNLSRGRIDGLKPEKYGMDAEVAERQARNWLDYRRVNPSELKFFAASNPIVADILSGEISESAGNLYTVTLKVEDEDLLDWDKPLSEQSEKVRKALGRMGFEVKEVKMPAEPDARWGQIGVDTAGKTFTYDQAASSIYLSLKSGNPQEASAALLAAGIRGIRYLDGNSRGNRYYAQNNYDGSWSAVVNSNVDSLKFETESDALKRANEIIGEGSYNYVIFDEADIEIVEVNGTPVNLSQPSFSLGRAWPENFPNVTISTTVGKMKSHPAYTAAKAGSTKDAFRVVNDLLKIDRIRELGRQFPDAIVAGLHAEEATGHNKLPEALAEAIAHHANLELDEHIVIINTPKRTGSTAIHRLAARPELAGDVQAGRKYILADDVATQGGTLSEARAYIEERGGEVVAAVTMAAAQGGTVLAMAPKTKLALQEKFGDSQLHEFATAAGLYQGQWQALTNSEAIAILRYSKLQTATDAILAARQAAGAPGIAPATRSSGILTQGRFSFSLGRIDNESIRDYFSNAHEGETLETAVRDTADLFAWAQNQPLGLRNESRPAYLRGQALQEVAYAAFAGPGSNEKRLIGKLRELEAFAKSGKPASILLDGMISRDIPAWNPIGTLVETPEDVFAVNAVFRNPWFESVRLMAVDENNRIVAVRVHSVGFVSESAAHIGEMIGFLMEAKANTPNVRLIVSHNHPSGDPSPSRADENLQRRLEDAASKAGVEVLDHVITNGTKGFSMRNMSTFPIGKELDVNWTSVERTSMPTIDRPEYIMTLGSIMRASNPNANWALYLDTRLQVRAMNLLPDVSADAANVILRDMSTQGAENVILFASSKAWAWNANVIESIHGAGRRVIDSLHFSSGSYISAREAGMMEESAPYNVQGQPSYALSFQGTMNLEAAVAARMTRGPAERIEYFERVRNRLAAMGLQMRGAKRNLQSDDQDERTRERNRIRDAVAEGRAIIDALPPEVRGKVRFDSNRLIDAETERGQIGALKDLIAEIDKALEKHLVMEYRERFDILLDLAKPDLRQDKSLRGRLTAFQQRQITKIQGMLHLDQVELTVALKRSEAEIARLVDEYPNLDPDDKDAIEAHRKALADERETEHFLNMFGAFVTLDAAQLARAFETLESIYITGRTQRKILDEQQREEMKQAQMEVVGSLPKATQSKWAKRMDDAGMSDLAKAAVLGLSSFHQVMERIFPRSLTARDIQDKVRAADRAFIRAKLEAHARFESFTNKVWNLTGTGARRKRNRILHELSKLTDEWEIQLFEKTKSEEIKLTEEQAEAILAGKMKVGWETDPIAMQSLQNALDDFLMQRRKAQNEQRAFRSKVIRFRRYTGSAPQGDLYASPLQVIYWMQLYAQESYRPALDRYGFTKEVMEKLERQIAAKYPKANDVADFLRDEYDAEWSRLNPTYRAIYGMDMPKHANYAPGSFEHARSQSGGDSTISEDGRNAAVNAMSAGFTKARQHHLARPKQTNALAKYWSHTEQTEYFIAYAELVRDIRSIFRAPHVRRAVEATHGKRAADVFSWWLDAIETDGNVGAAKLDALAELSGWVMAGQAAVGLAYNIGVLFKQLSASFGFLTEMPTKRAVVGLSRMLRNPGHFRTVWQSEAIQQRIMAGMSPEDRQILQAGAVSPSMLMEWLELGRLPIAYTDAAFTTLSASVAYADAYAQAIKAKLSDSAAHEAALAVASRVVERNAQPASTQDKSQTELSIKSWGRFFIMFRSDPRQKFAISVNAVLDYKEGKISGAAAIRKVFWNWSIYGLAPAILSDVWMGMSRDDDDEDRWQWNDYAAAALAGPIAGVPILGEVADFAIRSLFQADVFENNPNPLSSSAYKLPYQTKRLIAGITGEKPPASVNEFLSWMQQAAGSAAIVFGALDKRGVLPATAAALRLTRDVQGMASNTIDLIHGPDETDKALDIIRPFAEQDTENRDAAAENRKAIVKEMAKLDPQTRARRLASMTPDERNAVTRSLRAADMTDPEKALSRLSKAQREKAIAAWLDSLPSFDRAAQLERLEQLGLK